MSSFLLAVLLFAQCQKEANEINNIDEESARRKKETTVSSSISGQTKLDLTKGYKESSYAYYVDIPEVGDSESQPASSTLKLFENGKEIGPAHALHRDIRNIGGGRFSHWGTSLYFSASDNTNPLTNGRVYSYTYGSGDNKKDQSPSTSIPVTGESPIGYASVDGKTTGGQGGKTITVTTLKDFANAVASSEPLIIQVSGSFSGTGMIQVKSNKTIIGVNGATLNGVGLAMYGVNNIIIKNMKINRVVGTSYDCITIKEASHHIWVDHCEFWQDRTHGWEYYDELLEVTDRSDYVTLSWNKFRDSFKGILIGSGDYQTTDKGHLRVTLHHNYFYNITERQPCTRFGYIHYFNNYMTNNDGGGSGYALGVTVDATVRTDNNYFENQNNPIRTDFNLRPGFVSGANTNIYKNSGANKITTAESNWVPSYEYKSVLIAAQDVPSIVSSGAGVK